MNENLNITIRIASQSPMYLAINRADEEVMRKAEYNVNRLVNSWTAKYKGKSPSEILAMVAFRFAELYFRQLQAIEIADDNFGQFEQELDRIIHSMSTPGIPSAEPRELPRT